ncbi:MAG: PilZ domain-containing protein [Desulfomicrobium escambiense]|nr:PilZ domain-containing protein [Desulfomicrobium escambiense]
MAEKGIERRLCQRFKIPGATVSYRKEQAPSAPKTRIDEEFCPVLDLSRGGIRFLTQKPLKFKSRITLHVSIPGERVPLDLKGRVRWSTFNAGKSYKYQAGVQFNPYGLEKGQNVPQIADADRRPRAEVRRAGNRGRSRPADRATSAPSARPSASPPRSPSTTTSE